MIVLATVFVLSWESTIQQPISGFIINLFPQIPKDINWLAIISIILFLGFVIWVLWDQSVKIQNLEDAKPAIGLSKMGEEDDHYYLEIKNTGNAGVFSAQIEVKESTVKYEGKLYTGYWIMDTQHNKAEIKRDQVDRLKTVYFIDKGSAGKQVCLDYYDSESGKLATLSYEWGHRVNPNDPHSLFTSIISKNPQYTLRIIISSIPDLKGGSFTIEYKIDGEELYKRKDEKTSKIMNLLTLMANPPRTSMMKPPEK